MEPTRLEDLPAFRVQRIEADERPCLFGVFTHTRSVQIGRSWLYDSDDPLIGDLTGLDVATREAVFEAPFWTPSSNIQVGSSPAWVNGYYQAWHIGILLDPAADWRRRRFEATDAHHFTDHNGRGFSTKASPLIDGVPDSVEPGGWDHEHCSLCMERIGRLGSEYGYLACGHAWADYDCWLCDTCGERYAVPRSLAFIWPRDAV